MLKIWLNWLQPSLGVLGVVLVLSNALCAHAASKATGKETSKVSTTGNSPLKGANKPDGFTLPQQMTTFSPTVGVSLPPDVAIRRLALDTIANSQPKLPNLDTQAARKNRGSIVGLTAPSTALRSVGAKPTDGNLIKSAVAKPFSSTAVYLPTPTAAPLVAGLFIGRSSGNVERFSPTTQPVLAPVAKVAVPVATPTVVASAVVAEPFPVMLPERMQQFNIVETVATENTSPTVAQSTRSTNTVASGLQNILGGESSRQAGDSLDTAVASGLQNVLGESNAIDTGNVVALNKLVVPELKVPTTTRGSLQLATSQSYVSAAKFDLPGVAAPEPVVKSAQSIAKVVVGKNIRKDLSTAVVQRKTDYVALMSDRDLGSQSPPSWQTMSRNHSLGGLILGSRSTNEIAAIPTQTFKTRNYGGFEVFNPGNQY